MALREQIEGVIAQVKTLREQGETHLYLEDATLAELRKLAPKNAKPIAPAPSHTTGAVSLGDFAHAASAPASRGIPAKPSVRAASVAHDDTIPEPPVFELPAGDKQAQWNWLREKVLGCPVCNGHLHPNRKVVFGVGSLDADIFFCGEAPGMDESVQGEPFVGPAGQLLTKMIVAMGLSRESVYIGNIMNWRPKQATEVGNRPPKQQEMDFCLPYIKAQLAIVKPKVIVALGGTAANGLLAPAEPYRMGAIRGKWFQFEGIDLIPTYHPSYLLRNQLMSERRKVWEDLLAAMERVGLPVSEKQRGFFLKK